MKLTIAEAEAQGFTVDTTVYPHFGYKGNRFAPIETVKVYTETEQALLGALPFPALLERAAKAYHRGSPDIEQLREAASRIQEVLEAVR